jgi:uncharacterized protein YndB with AHSA1/START domain
MTSTTTSRSVVHDTFTLERTYDASPARVFAAFADQEAKRLWFGDPDGWSVEVWDMDFRVGGRELNRATLTDGPTMIFEAIYLDIVQDERIVYTYQMEMGGERISVSLSTIELFTAGAGTRLVMTEQGAFLDGHDKPEGRKEGTEGLLDALGVSLGKDIPSA